MTDNFQISLKAARVNAGIHQKEAAKRLGISNSTLVKWEQDPGKVPGQKMTQIAALYGIPVQRISFFTH